MLTEDVELYAALARDPSTAPLQRRQRALVDYALKLTLKPDHVTEEDLIPLREANFSDSAIHDAVAITAYFNFVNRIASALGVHLEQ